MAFHKSHRLLCPYRLLFHHCTCSSLHHSNHRYAFLLLLCGLRLLLSSHSHIYDRDLYHYALLPLLRIHHSYDLCCHPYVLMPRLVLHLTALCYSPYSRYHLCNHPRYRLLLSNLESLCLPHGWLDLFLHMAFHKSHRSLYLYRLLLHHCN